MAPLPGRVIIAVQLELRGGVCYVRTTIEGTQTSNHTCWSGDYLLAHCEGYRVESDERTIGYVEEVVPSHTGTKPFALRVRTVGRRPTLVTISVGNALEVHAPAERIVVRSR